MDNTNTAPQEPLEQTPVQPQEGWNPPTGDEDFDSLFQRTGIDGENITDSNAIPVEPTTEPTEPAVQTTPATPTPSKFKLETKTGTIYNDPEEAVRGIEQKDQLINQLRSMVAAATGEDPLSKSGAKPGTVQTAQQPVSYLKDSRRYAEDLTKAADLGQKSGNWDPYRNVQAQLQYEIVQSAVGPYMPVVQNVGKQQALDEVTRDNPEFRKFYGSEEYQKVLEERPKIAEFIRVAETQPTLQEELRELYRGVWDSAQARKIPELVKQSQQPQNPTPPRMPLSSMARPSLQVPDQGRQNLTTQKPDLRTSAGRKAIMEEAEAKGIADIAF